MVKITRNMTWRGFGVRWNIAPGDFNYVVFRIWNKEVWFEW